MATLKENCEQVLAIAGADDFKTAMDIISTWRDRAVSTVDPVDYEKVNEQLDQIFEVADAKAHADALANINGMKNSITALWEELGVKDQESALAVIKKFETDNVNFKSKVGEMEKAKENFEKRVNAEVIARAASAGIREPVKKEIHKPGAEANMLTRAEFNTLSPAQQVEFSKGGGKLSD